MPNRIKLGTKAKQPPVTFAARFNDDTLDKLAALKGATGFTATNIVVQLIDAAYRDRFGDKKPKPRLKE